MMFVYDLKRQPPWFDFITFLAICACEAGGPFDLTILDGRRPDRLKVDDATREGFVHTVMLPATRLFHVKHLNLFPPHYGGNDRNPGYLARNFPPSRPIPSLKVPEWALRWVKQRYPEPPVVISLRESTHNAFRNSDLAVYRGIAVKMDCLEHPVVALRDTTATGEIGMPSDWACSHNLILRAALMQHAEVNLGTVHGPTSLAIMNTRARYCFFNKCPPVEHLTMDWMRQVGYLPGEDEPWAVEGQRVFWERESVDRVLEEVERLPDVDKTRNEFPGRRA